MIEKISAVVPYDENWALNFQTIKESVFPAIADVIIGFEHIGSTAVPGLAAKPIIDIDAIYEADHVLPVIIDRLERLGYQYQGEKGIAGRSAFKAPAGPSHHLYVCRQGCLALRNHLAVRDHLRANREDRDAYGALKLGLAGLYEMSPAAYGEAKTQLLLQILAKCGITKSELDAVENANRAP